MTDKTQEVVAQIKNYVNNHICNRNDQIWLSNPDVFIVQAIPSQMTDQTTIGRCL